MNMASSRCRRICAVCAVIVGFVALSGCEQGPGSRTVGDQAHVNATKTKPTLPEAWMTGSGGGRVDVLRNAVTQDDHGDSRSAATRVTAGTSTSGNLAANDVDFFVITVAASPEH